MVTQTTLATPTVAVRDAIQKTFVPATILSGFTDAGHFELLAGEYLASLGAKAKSQLLARADKTRKFVATLAPFQPANVVGAEITGPHVDAIRADPLFIGAFGQRPYTFARVDITQLVALQPWVEPRGDPIPTGHEEQLKLALPHKWEVPAEFSFVPPNGPLQVFTSNPALQALAIQADIVNQVVLLSTLKHINLVQVVHFSGRHYLRNGYHRVADALADGLKDFPAIVTEAMVFPQDVQLPSHAAFNPQYFAGLPRPPLLSDFHTRAALRAKVRERRYGVIVSVVPISIGI